VSAMTAVASSPLTVASLALIAGVAGCCGAWLLAGVLGYKRGYSRGAFEASLDATTKAMPAVRRSPAWRPPVTPDGWVNLPPARQRITAAQATALLPRVAEPYRQGPVTTTAPQQALIAEPAQAADMSRLSDQEWLDQMARQAQEFREKMSCP
jgi:hypothetical protein